ncbi:DUF1499 domain-containing protein [Salipiger sp. IMCC34102]|uniref:DUF1499 domain-containing protein n=1 Tax=Salipiger sp. IMCC34102 TaxID=2510647 RepID=UPI00101DAB43|nr:DUF1499 domain-containing protein [Salipiger sp. IMCC34102]RYH03220.1 DUF1499 domain-containing protein [Salipiger sp. IMCC34102]
MIATVILFLILAVAAVMAYVRLAPVDIAAFHTPPSAAAPGDEKTLNSFKAVRTMTAPPADVLRGVRTMAEDRPRTRLMAGDVAEGLMTFETRSALMGYPDYTTVTVTEAQPPLLAIKGRSRYGKGDMGVNKARVEDWLSRLGPLVAPAS